MFTILYQKLKLQNLRVLYWTLDKLSNLRFINRWVFDKKLFVGAAIISGALGTNSCHTSAKDSKRLSKDSSNVISNLLIENRVTSKKIQDRSEKKQAGKDSINDLKIYMTCYDVVYVDDNDSIEPLFSSEKEPQFIGGEDSLRDYLSNNIYYSEGIEEIEGRVYVRFVVMKDGRIDRVSVLRGIHPLLDSEAIRVVKTMPRWIPGQQDGNVVNVWYTMPINFTWNR